MAEVESRKSLGLRISGILIATTSVWMISGQTAMAQSPPAETKSGGDALEEITVTAQFRSENLQTTPIAITAISGAMLEARGQTNFLQLASEAPNVVIQPAPQGYGNTAQIQIRGISQGDASLGLEPGVGVYIDDVYYATLFGTVFDLLDLDRVEILRGPQGTLAGMNAIGGAIKLYSKQPNGEGGGYVEAKYGSFRLESLRAAGDFTIIPDSVYARISGSAKQSDGYLTRYDYGCEHPASGFPNYATRSNCVLGTEGGTRDFALRGVVRWVASEQLQFNLATDVYRDNDEPTPTKLVSANPAAPVPTLNGVPFNNAFVDGNHYSNYATYNDPTKGLVLDPNNTLNAWGVGLTVDYDLGHGTTLKSVTGIRSQANDFVQDSSATAFNTGLVLYTVQDKEFTQEFRLNTSLGHYADLTAGGFYLHSVGGQGGILDSGPLYFFTDDVVKTSNKSGFLHAVIHATDKLDFIAGARYSDESKSFTFGRVSPTGGFVPIVGVINGLRGDFNRGRVDYRGGIEYRWTEQLMTYAQYSTGFRGGGINFRPFYPNQVVPFDQEVLKAAEFGLKADLFDGKGRANFSVFRNNYQKIQVQTNTPFFNTSLPVNPDITSPGYNPAGGTFPSAVIQNAGDARVSGAEVEFTLRPVHGLQLDTSASYLNFAYTSLLPQAIASGLRYGMYSEFSPRWKASAGLQYEIPFNTRSVTPRLDYSYQSQSFANAINADYNRLGSRSVLNALATYRGVDDVWESTVAVTNVTGAFYYYSLFANTPAVVTGLPSRPREWSLSVKRRF